MKAYEWMVEVTPQREWIERTGLFVWLAFYASVLGSGLYLVSLYFNAFAGMVIGWLIIVLVKSGFHFVHLGRPLRFWRMILNPATSWISRGFIVLLLFTLVGGVQIVLSTMAPGSPWELAAKVLAGALAFADGMYVGLAMSLVQAIPLWNSALLPVLLVLYGLMGGCALVMAIAPKAGQVDFPAVQSMNGLLLVVVTCLVVIYLWSAAHAGPTGRSSVLRIVRGRSAPLLWVGALLIGLAFPLGVRGLAYFAGIPPLLVIFSAIAEILGGMAFQYCLLKGGSYRPVIAGSPTLMMSAAGKDRFVVLKNQRE